MTPNDLFQIVERAPSQGLPIEYLSWCSIEQIVVGDRRWSSTSLRHLDDLDCIDTIIGGPSTSWHAAVDVLPPACMLECPVGRAICISVR